MKNIQIIDIINSEETKNKISVSGWVRTRRDSKNVSFIELYDGSCQNGLQVVFDLDKINLDEGVNTGASVEITGNLVKSLGENQKFEILCTKIKVFSTSKDDYPLQKKRHSREFLRTIPHLRVRTNLFGAITRLRGKLSFEIHKFFNKRNFCYVHTPIITGNDCEGAGDLFSVVGGKNSNHKEQFFNKSVFLTVSGQLEAETLATSISRVYTFGPTFRAENSNTRRHASEFWMLEPEVAFFDLDMTIKLAEDMLIFLTSILLDRYDEEMQIFYKFINKDLENKLQTLASGKFDKITYTEAVKLLKSSNQKFKFPIKFGLALQTEHEKWLAEEYFKKPVTVFDYPKVIKPFYMKDNEDGLTVRAFDVLVPGVGEIIGGSQREDSYDILKSKMIEHGLNISDYQWYLDLRKYGSVPHSGFGMGFERFLMFATSIENIRDVINFPRTPGSIF